MGEYNAIRALQLKLIEKNEAKCCGCLETLQVLLQYSVSFVTE